MNQRLPKWRKICRIAYRETHSSAPLGGAPVRPACALVLHRRIRPAPPAVG
jgi:hypothetical protein